MGLQKRVKRGKIDKESCVMQNIEYWASDRREMGVQELYRPTSLIQYPSYTSRTTFTTEFHISLLLKLILEQFCSCNFSKRFACYIDCKWSKKNLLTEKKQEFSSYLFYKIKTQFCCVNKIFLSSSQPNIFVRSKKHFARPSK